MNKFFLLLSLSLLWASSVFADVTFFNKSEEYDVQVTYRICGLPARSASYICKDDNTVTISAGKKVGEKSYVTIPTVYNPETDAVVSIDSAFEKNAEGGLVAQGNYDNGAFSECLGSLYMNQTRVPSEFGPVVPHKLNVGVVLDDMNGSPMIMCQTGLLSSVKIVR